MPRVGAVVERRTAARILQPSTRFRKNDVGPSDIPVLSPPPGNGGIERSRRHLHKPIGQRRVGGALCVVQAQSGQFIVHRRRHRNNRACRGCSGHLYRHAIAGCPQAKPGHIHLVARWRVNHPGDRPSRFYNGQRNRPAILAFYEAARAVDGVDDENALLAQAGR